MARSDLFKGKIERSSISKLLLCATPLLLIGCSPNNIYGISIPTGYVHTTKGSFVNPDPGPEPYERKLAENVLSEPNPDEALTTPVDVSQPAMVPIHQDPMPEKLQTNQTQMSTKPVMEQDLSVKPVHSHNGGPIPLTGTQPHQDMPDTHMDHSNHSMQNDMPAEMEHSAIMTPAPVAVSAHNMGTPASFDRWSEVSKTLIATLFKESGTPIKPVYITTVAGTPNVNAELEHSISKTLMGYGVSVLDEPSTKPVVLEYDVVRLGAGKSDQALVTFILYSDDGTVMEANRMFSIREN